MAITIELRFPAGRYHATLWGRHVNEGVPEWPPSPWRLLRALVAVWKRTCPEIPEVQVRRILEPLTVPPLFQLPERVNVAHTRHYMPWEKKGPDDRTLVFDTFVSLSRDEPVRVHWPEATLTAEDEVVLQRLLENMATLGRAEAWVQAGLGANYSGEFLSPLQADAAELNPVPVLCADPLSAFSDEFYPCHDPQKLAKGKIHFADYLFNAPRWHLCLDTETIHKERWPFVPGSKWVNYMRPHTSSASSSRRHQQRRDQTNFTVARFLLDGPVLPLTKHTVAIAEKFRSALMSRFNQWCDNNRDRCKDYLVNVADDAAPAYASPTFSGKDRDGNHLTGHDHAHYLPTSAPAGDQRRITHVTVYARRGFTLEETAALYSLRQLRMDNEMKLRVQLVGLGVPDDFNSPLLATSSHWESVTPFVVHRHLKRKSIILDSTSDDPHLAVLQAAVRDIARARGLPEICEIDWHRPQQAPPAREFYRSRNKDRTNKDARPFGFLKITFAAPVHGPLAMGYGSHFGLGLFRANEEPGSSPNVH